MISVSPQDGPDHAAGARAADDSKSRTQNIAMIVCFFSCTVLACALRPRAPPRAPRICGRHPNGRRARGKSCSRHLVDSQCPAHGSHAPGLSVRSLLGCLLELLAGVCRAGVLMPWPAWPGRAGRPALCNEAFCSAMTFLTWVSAHLSLQVTVKMRARSFLAATSACVGLLALVAAIGEIESVC